MHENSENNFEYEGKGKRKTLLKGKTLSKHFMKDSLENLLMLSIFPGMHENSKNDFD